MDSNAELVRAAYAAFAQGDIAAILDMLDERVEWSSPATLPQGGTFSGRAGVVKFFEGVGAAWESLRVQPEAVGEIGSDLVAGVIQGSGLLRGARPASYGAIHVFTVRNGKITRFREYADLDQALLP